MRATAPRGTRDVLPEEAARWQRLEAATRRVFHTFGYGEIRTPMFEHTELFQRGIGETTDIVQKEMYTFMDRGDRSLTLRPEGTAPVVRAYVEHKLYAGVQPVKLYYIGPMFRYERPQAGRYRQFHQIGAEAMGSADAAVDAEMIAMPITLYEEMGLRDVQVLLNSIGCPVCRPAYRELLRAHLAPRREELCGTCQTRYERNPLRLLDCKVPRCRELTEDVPSILDTLCDECRDHFAAVRTHLDRMGLTYQLEKRLVRGFDYYTKTVFELVSPHLGAQDAVGGGGRYDGLVAEMGGPDTPAVGFAVGVERLLLALEAEGREKGDGLARPHVYVAALGPDDRAQVVELTYRLRRAGVYAEMDYAGRSLRAQMRAAGQRGAAHVAIVGGEEAQRGMVRLRDMNTGAEREVALGHVVEVLSDGR